MAATILGTIKGIMGLSQTVTGMVIETTDFDYTSEKLKFPNQEGQTTSVAFVDEEVKFTLKGLLVAGTAYTGTINSTITLTSMPAHLGTMGTGLSIIESIKIGEQAKSWKSLEISGTYHPHVTAA